MSDPQPPENNEPEDTTVLGDQPDQGGQPEGTEPTTVLPPAPAAAVPTAGPSATEPASRSGRRTAVVLAVAAVVVALLAGGAFALYTVFFGGGPQPADALPASTVAIVSVDLDPSAGQKIAAIKAIRKFPALKKSLGLKTRDDLRRFIFDKAVESGTCTNLDYDKDVKPWIGKRVALAAVDLGAKKPVPALALQVSDRGKAKAGFDKIVACAAGGKDLGYAIGDDYLIASDTTAHAKAILLAGQKASLADDDQYKKWTDKAGDRGVVNFYVAKRSVDYLSDALASFADGLTGTLGAGSGDPVAALTKQLKGFGGLAGTVRFAGGGMEMSVAAGGLDGYTSTSSIGNQVSALPKDSVLVAGIAVPKGYASTLVDNIKAAIGDEDVDLVAEAEQETGLQLPGDLATLLGSGVTLSVGGTPPDDLADLTSLADLPLGLVLHGDGSKIKDIITKVQDHVGVSLADIEVGVLSSDSKVVLSPSKNYAEDLLGKGTLGGSSTFTDAVPNADKASAIVYLNFDSAWRAALIKLARDTGADADDVDAVEANTAPLKSLGISTWSEGKVSHFLLKVATD
ncbi:MAG: DUF3352 domain-containing protein [Marmoricola sp.]